MSNDYAIEILIYGEIWELKKISAYDFLEISEQYLAIREGYSDLVEFKG